MDTETEPADEGAVVAGSADEVLQRAVTFGVLSREEAELIGSTRLEQVSLREVADQASKGDWALTKGRSRAMERLASTIVDGCLGPDALLDGRPRGVVVGSVSPVVSKRAWALALFRGSSGAHTQGCGSCSTC